MSARQQRRARKEARRTERIMFDRATAKDLSTWAANFLRSFMSQNQYHVLYAIKHGNERFWRQAAFRSTLSYLKRHGYLTEQMEITERGERELAELAKEYS